MSGVSRCNHSDNLTFFLLRPLHLRDFIGVAPTTQDLFRELTHHIPRLKKKDHHIS